MAELDLRVNLGNSLNDLLLAEEIKPGDTPSYQLCKTIYTLHPIGAKMVDKPIKLAMAQGREISIPNSPETRVRDRFNEVWAEMGCNVHIANTMSLSRVYGVSTLVLKTQGVPSDRPIDFKALPDAVVELGEWDPLNTAGTLVQNQDPNAMDFQKKTGPLAVQGRVYHQSRCCVMMNENPIYIDYTSSAFGYVGRSVYQRALYPLKSFLQTMITDHMVAKKSGLLIAKLKQAGSAINNLMARIAGQKREMVKMGATNNVISISSEDNEEITTLNMQNLEGPAAMARKNILENIAASDDMPAILLNEESFAEGFADGTEDAKAVARYIDGFREKMQPLYDFCDRIVMYRAWSPEFYKTIQAEFDDYAEVPFNRAFMDWCNAFSAKFPSTLTEPDSEKVKVDDVKLKAAIAIVETLLPAVDPVNKASVIEWLADNLNDMKFLFTSPLILDIDAIASYTPPQPAMGGEGEGEQPENEGSSFARADDDRAGAAMRRYQEAVDRLQAPAASRLRSREVRRITRGGGSATVTALVDHAVRHAARGA